MTPNTNKERSRALLAGLLAAGGVLAAQPVVADAASPVRIEHGPQVYRLNPTGAKYGIRNTTAYSYAVVFMQSRVVLGSTFEDDDSGDVRVGDFSLAGVELPGYTQGHLYSSKYRPQHCVVAFIDRKEALKSESRKLDRIRIGQKVSVSLRPLESTKPKVSYGRTFKRKVTMRQGSRYTLTESGVQHQLRQIGCNRRG